MSYKKIIRSRETRFKLLHLLRFIPDNLMIELQYMMKLGRRPNLKEPKRYTEKLQWYKLHYRSPLMTQCSDKYSVRKYIESKGLSSILNKLYAVYDDVDEIDTSILPDKFVLKTTNGSGTNYFCTDKSRISEGDLKNNIEKWMRRDIYSSGREWSYKDVVPRIIAEEFLEDNDNRFNGINDYKFLCFNGEPKYVVLDVDRQTSHKRNIYDIEWNFLDVSTDHPNFGDTVDRPAGLDQMLNIARILSEDFPFVRVDLYWVCGKPYFGELTFYPWTGYVQFDPDEFDFILGRDFLLPRIARNKK